MGSEMCIRDSPPEALNPHVGRRMSWKVEVIGHGFVTFVCCVSKVFFERSGEESASLSYVDLVPRGTRNSIDNVFRITREMSGDVKGVSWAVDGG